MSCPRFWVNWPILIWVGWILGDLSWYIRKQSWDLSKQHWKQNRYQDNSHKNKLIQIRIGQLTRINGQLTQVLSTHPIILDNSRQNVWTTPFFSRKLIVINRNAYLYKKNVSESHFVIFKLGWVVQNILVSWSQLGMSWLLGELVFGWVVRHPTKYGIIATLLFTNNFK